MAVRGRAFQAGDGIINVAVGVVIILAFGKGRRVTLKAVEERFGEENSRPSKI